MRALIREWDSLSFLLVMRRNPGKSHTECLNKIVSRLTDIQTALSDANHAEPILKINLLDTVKDVFECQQAHQKPADSIPGFISDLHSTLATSATTTTNQDSSLETPALLYAEKGIHKPRYHHVRNICFQ